MRFSTKTRYGTRAMVELATHYGKGLIPLKNIAGKQEIPFPYLKHIISPLSNAGLIRSERGNQGGIALTKKPDEIKLNLIIRVLEGSMAPVGCVDDRTYCQRYDKCNTRWIWSDVCHAIDNALAAITLQDLVDRQIKSTPDSEQIVYDI